MGTFLQTTDSREFSIWRNAIKFKCLEARTESTSFFSSVDQNQLTIAHRKSATIENI